VQLQRASTYAPDDPDVANMVARGEAELSERDTLLAASLEAFATAPESEVDGEAEETEQLAIPDTLPILPLKNTVLFPFLLHPLLVNTERSKTLIDAVLVSSQRLMMSVAVRHPVEGSPGTQDLYRAGTVLRIVKMIKFPDDSYRLLVQGVSRARVQEFTSELPFLRGRIETLRETGEFDSVETTALMRNVAQEFAALVAESSRLSDELQLLAGSVDDPSKLADLAGSNLDFDLAGKQSVLEELDVPERLKLVLDGISREREVMKVESEIREKVQTDIGKTQRDYMLRQQLEAIRQELGEGGDQESETERLRERIAEALEKIKEQQEQGEAQDPSAKEMSESLEDAEQQTAGAEDDEEY